MLSRDAMSIVVNQSSVAELGLWRQTSRGLRNLVMVEECNRYLRMQPAEKIEYLCHIAILISENPELYRNDDLFKTQLRRMAQSVFPNELIAALTLACLSRITSTSIQTLNDGDLSSLSPIMIRAIKVVAGEKSNPCTLDEVSTLETPVLARFCARILGLQDYDIKTLIQRLPEGIAFDPLIKNHHNLLLPILLTRIDDVAVFEEICSRIFSADEEMADPSEICLLYIRSLQRVSSCSLSSSQSVMGLPLMLGKLSAIHLLSNLCQRIDSKNIARAVEILLKFFQRPVADPTHCTQVLDIIFYELLPRTDTAYVHQTLKQLIPMLKYTMLEIREAMLSGLFSLRHHLVADISAMLIPDLLPLTIYQDSLLLRFRLLATLIQYMDDVTVQAFLAQSLECLTNTLNESDHHVIFPVLTALLEHPAIDKEKTVSEIARIMLEKVSATVHTIYEYTSLFIKYVVPLYDPDSEKFVLPFLRALFHAYDWTSELIEESIPVNLENAAKYIVLHNELNHGALTYSSFIKTLAPRLSDTQAQRLWGELEDIGEIGGHPVDDTFAQVLIEKLTLEQQLTAKSLILKHAHPDVLENACQALLYLGKTELCSNDEIGSVLLAVDASKTWHRNWLRAHGSSPSYDHTKYICQTLTELGAIDYLRKLFVDPDVMIRAEALPGIVRLLPQCAQIDVIGLLEDFNSELQGRREQSTPEMQLQAANALYELAKVYPMKFKERLFTVLFMVIAEAEPPVCASLYQALATSLSVLDEHEQTPYIKEILPLLTRGTQNLVTVFAMVKSLPNLIAKLEADSLRSLLDTLTAADPEAANDAAKVLQVLIKVFTQADQQPALQTIASHPRARILCGLLLPAALLPEPVTPDTPVHH